MSDTSSVSSISEESEVELQAAELYDYHHMVSHIVQSHSRDTLRLAVQNDSWTKRTAPKKVLWPLSSTSLEQVDIGEEMDVSEDVEAHTLWVLDKVIEELFHQEGRVDLMDLLQGKLHRKSSKQGKEFGCFGRAGVPVNVIDNVIKRIGVLQQLPHSSV
jgi:hypothetical protein